MTDVHVLDVLLYGNPIGTLTRVGDDRALFACNDSYIEDNEAALKFSRTKRFDRYSENELSHLAAKALLPEKLVLDTARETVALLYRHWN
ncbi:MAG: hypothetical protein F4Y78_04895 [Candidatus Dadabacteria bacterium]|nr:hypothetical protein [Candidatus Dadabacteria bacterium]MYA48797.1 hypothetical protein [Candidatus Dadabacteria bacterium]MYK49868.1 hypothetical protein [Candidatus Dadabacteria bacterium]